MVRLVDVDEDDDSAISYSYVTLSHRWGTPEPPKLSVPNNAADTGTVEEEEEEQPGKISINRLRTGVPSAFLPRLFQQAIQIVQHCGFEYLWIDCLCIVQDKTLQNANEDWENEARKMGDIYAGGILYGITSHLRYSFSFLERGRLSPLQPKGIGSLPSLEGIQVTP